MPTPEELARHNIDAFLVQCGWLIQDYKKLDLSAGRGIAIQKRRDGRWITISGTVERAGGAGFARYGKTIRVRRG